MREPLHIVCLDAPSPPDYGGAIDMYYKIKALYESGREIHLHYFHYNPKRNTNGLEPYCKSIQAYKRKSFFFSLPIQLPFIVGSRINRKLISNLNSDDHNVLLEGIHASGVIPYLHKKRKIVIRMHNDEAEYYKLLIRSEKNLLRKLYFSIESRLLKKYQQQIDKEIPLACVSETDMKVLWEQYRLANLHFVPSFTPWQQVDIQTGTGEYCLYHGNMQVSENIAVASWLIDVFADLSIPLVIAGKGINHHLKEKVTNGKSAIKLVSDPNENVLDDLIRNAQLHVLPSFNNTGLKLKVLHALFYGRHCITNDAGIAGTHFLNTVHIANDVETFRTKILSLFHLPFTEQDIEKRKQATTSYSNKINAEKLNALV